MKYILLILLTSNTGAVRTLADAGVFDTKQQCHQTKKALDANTGQRSFMTSSGYKIITVCQEFYP